MAVTHRARLSPLQAETSWTLDAGEIVERRGAHERRFGLADLKALHASPTGVVLSFPRARMAIPALTYGGGLRPMSATDSFEPFLAALREAAHAAAPRARQRPAPPRFLGAVVWVMSLMGAGALGLLGFAAASGSWALGVTLAARLVFLLILAGAALPWLRRR
ncbi:MAG TPA: hypothetical protein VFW47_13705 [Phenylobacterium sp.]|nr:hypothetical protein [Phenylobacterium sp.]